MSDTLKDLVVQSGNLVERLIEAGGELTPELEAELMVIETKLPAKIDAYAFIIDRMEVEADFFYGRAKRFETVANSLVNIRKNLHERIKQTMIEGGLKELKGIEERFLLSKAKARLIVESPDRVPDKYKRTTVTTTVDNDKLRGDLEDNVEVEGCKLEPSYGLRKYVNK